MILQDWQDALAQKPHDWDLRLVFADWLDDQGDETSQVLARGQRWQAQHHRVPVFLKDYQPLPWSWFDKSSSSTRDFEDLEPPLFRRVFPLGTPYQDRDYVVDFASLAEAEWALALALEALQAQGVPT
jgi:uncharacterized protein (TIGR02996 family)